MQNTAIANAPRIHISHINLSEGPMPRILPKADSAISNDPVIDLWNEYHKAWDEIAEADKFERPFEEMSIEGKRLYKEQHPELNDECWSKEYKAALDHLDQVEEKIQSIVATSAEGLVAQIDYLNDLMEREIDNVERLLATIKAGVKNLQKVQAVTQYNDPVITLAAKERKARDAFNRYAKGATIKDEQSPGYKKVESNYSKAYREFIDTPATSLDGLYLQAKYLVEENEVDEVGVLLNGLKNVMNNQRS